MALYKGVVKFTSCAEVWFEAADQTAANAHMENITEAEIRQETLWADIFKDISAQEVVSVEEQ